MVRVMKKGWTTDLRSAGACMSTGRRRADKLTHQVVAIRGKEIKGPGLLSSSFERSSTNDAPVRERRKGASG